MDCGPSGYLPWIFDDIACKHRLGSLLEARQQKVDCTPWILDDVACVDGQGGQAEDGEPCAVAGEIHQCAKGIACPPVMHVGHGGAEMGKLGLLHLHKGHEGQD